MVDNSIERGNKVLRILDELEKSGAPRMTPKIVENIIQEIRARKTFCVAGHIRPDGDCVGSQLADGHGVAQPRQAGRVLERGRMSRKAGVSGSGPIDAKAAGGASGSIA